MEIFMKPNAKTIRAIKELGVLSDTTVSCCGLTITIDCGSHDTKDGVLEILIGGLADENAKLRHDLDRGLSNHAADISDTQ